MRAKVFLNLLVSHLNSFYQLLYGFIINLDDAGSIIPVNGLALKSKYSSTAFFLSFSAHNHLLSEIHYLLLLDKELLIQF